MTATEETIFSEAIEKHDRQERSDYLDEACAGDATLRHRVEQLSSAYRAGKFLESPADGLAATVNQQPAEKPDDQARQFRRGACAAKHGNPAQRIKVNVRAG